MKLNMPFFFFNRSRPRRPSVHRCIHGMARKSSRRQSFQGLSHIRKWSKNLRGQAYPGRPRISLLVLAVDTLQTAKNGELNRGWEDVQPNVILNARHGGTCFRVSNVNNLKKYVIAFWLGYLETFWFENIELEICGYNHFKIEGYIDEWIRFFRFLYIPAILFYTENMRLSSAIFWRIFFMYLYLVLYVTDYWRAVSRGCDLLSKATFNKWTKPS